MFGISRNTRDIKFLANKGFNIVGYPQYQFVLYSSLHQIQGAPLNIGVKDNTHVRFNYEVGSKCAHG